MLKKILKHTVRILPFVLCWSLGFAMLPKLIHLAQYQDTQVMYYDHGIQALEQKDFDSAAQMLKQSASIWKKEEKEYSWWDRFFYPAPDQELAALALFHAGNILQEQADQEDQKAAADRKAAAETKDADGKAVVAPKVEGEPESATEEKSVANERAADEKKAKEKQQEAHEKKVSEARSLYIESLRLNSGQRVLPGSGTRDDILHQYGKDFCTDATDRVAAARPTYGEECQLLRLQKEADDTRYMLAELNRKDPNQGKAMAPPNKDGPGKNKGAHKGKGDKPEKAKDTLPGTDPQNGFGHYNNHAI